MAMIIKHSKTYSISSRNGREDVPDLRLNIELRRMQVGVSLAASIATLS